MDLLDALWDEPFFEGSPTSEEVPGRMPVAIGGHAYRLELSQYKRRTLPIRRDDVDQGNEPGEQSLSTAGLWRRTQQDWRDGAGQQYLDDPDSMRTRFRASKGLDPWERREVCLLPDTELKNSSSDTNLVLLVAGDYCYKVEGQTLAFTADMTPASPSFTAVTLTGIAANITSATSDGQNVFVANGTSIWKATNGGAGAFAAFGTYAADLVGYANGRLLAANEAELVDVAAAGTTTVVHTHTNPTFDWTVVCAAPNGIYVGGSAGSTSEIYFLGVDPTDGSLNVPFVVGLLPEGEVLRAMVHYGGFLFIGTTRGVRMAQIREDGGLAIGSVIEVGEVLGLEPQEEFVWFTWTNYDSVSSGLGRLNPTRFTSPLVPAYASDLMATAQGASQSVVTFEDRRYFAISASGFWGQTANLVASGTLYTGWITYGIPDRKVGAALDMQFEALAGSLAPLIVVDDLEDGTTLSLTAFDTPGATNLASPYDLSTLGGERFELQLTFTRDAVATTGPCLRRWTSRFLAAPFRADEIIAPIIMRSMVTTMVGEGDPYPYNTLAEYQYLKRLENDGAIVAYQEGTSTYRVVIDGIEIQPEKWVDASRGYAFFETLMFVRMVTIEPVM